MQLRCRDRDSPRVRTAAEPRIDARGAPPADAGGRRCRAAPLAEAEQGQDHHRKADQRIIQVVLRLGAAACPSQQSPSRCASTTAPCSSASRRRRMAQRGARSRAIPVDGCSPGHQPVTCACGRSQHRRRGALAPSAGPGAVSVRHYAKTTGLMVELTHLLPGYSRPRSSLHGADVDGTSAWPSACRRETGERSVAQRADGDLPRRPARDADLIIRSARSAAMTS